MVTARPDDGELGLDQLEELHAVLLAQAEELGAAAMEVSDLQVRTLAALKQVESLRRDLIARSAGARRKAAELREDARALTAQAEQIARHRRMPDEVT